MIADICLLVEGTYPYATGGVSQWIHDLITHLPDLRFALVRIGSQQEKLEFRYTLPDNVCSFDELFIHDTSWTGSPRPSDSRTAAWQELCRFHSEPAARAPGGSRNLLEHLTSGEQGTLPIDLVHGREGWDLLLERYRTSGGTGSFSRYFWTFRFTHFPLFHLLTERVPPARLYHAVSTGYNAFAGAIAKIHTGAPFLITEHGIYAREREIEISQAAWIHDEADHSEADLLRDRWLDMFRYATQVSYDFADVIVSITKANQPFQLRYGAARHKMRVIPNGTDVDRWAALRPQPVETTGFSVGCIGRVVPIKDIKTFIRAVRIASTVIPDLDAYIVGPTDEDPAYVEECRRVLSLLELEGDVHFVGPADVGDYYGKLDVVVLTSLSEAQPLVILEASSAGIPVVATDVGDCSGLLVGVDADDRAVGPSGLLTPPGSPEATADALVTLWRDPDMRSRLGAAGRRRMRRLYRDLDMYSAYRDLYESCLAGTA